MTLGSSRRPFDHDEFTILRRNVREIAPPTSLHLLETTQQVPEASDEGSATKGMFQSTNVFVADMVGAGGLATKRSYERQRDTAPMSPAESNASSSPFVTRAPDSVPSPPTSPTNTFSTISQISSIDQDVEHWALQVFRDIPCQTALPTSKEKSEYHDVPGQITCDPPGDSYDEVVVLGFPPDPPGLKAALVYRRRDWRAKLVAQWKDRRGKTRKACIPLSMLVVYRRGPMLHFCRRLTDKKSHLAWLSLKFTSLESKTYFRDL